MKCTILIALSGLVFLFACTDNPQSNEDKNHSLDTLAYNYKHLRKESSNIIKNESGADTTYISVTYPQFKPAAINSFVVQIILVSDNPDVEYKTLDELTSGFIGNYDEFFASGPEYPRTWFKEINLKVTSQATGLVSFEENVSDYTGGAHGNYGTYFYNYDLYKKRALRLSDLFTAQNIEKLNNIAEATFRRNEGISNTASLDEDYFFENGMFRLNENFLILKNGLKFLYNPYEIKAYAAGITELIIPYPEIDNLLKENTVLQSHITR